MDFPVSSIGNTNPVESDDSIDIQNPQIEGAALADLQTASDQLVAEGLRPVAVPPGQKGPRTKDWPKLAGTSQGRDLLEEVGNIGVLFGGPERLCDVDQDWDSASVLAPLLLPETEFWWGHEQRPDTHRAYRVSGAGPLKLYRKLCDPEPDDDEKATIVELRGTSRHQTLVPPSTHPPTGGEYRWVHGGSGLPKPAQIDEEELVSGAYKVGAGSLILLGWRPGQRHDLVLSVAGLMAKRGHEVEHALEILGACEKVRDYDSDLEKDIRGTFAKAKQGKPVTGFGELKKLVGKRRTETLTEWLGGALHDLITARPGCPLALPGTTGPSAPVGRFCRLAGHFPSHVLIVSSNTRLIMGRRSRAQRPPPARSRTAA